MGGRVHRPEDLSREHVGVLRTVQEQLSGLNKFKDLRRRLEQALTTCPRESCAYCWHQARMEEHRARVQNPE